ncbi:ABC transporter substrate-binding protein [Halosegnis longus]|uniref:ABC transporter substrate-binding protein n=1 Tax=Halosegnis longus TaxID=2216012 RepID=A0AAJ4UVR4_9EURY|nr:ABC transporter substrate-binding protein [Halosegnis longus]RNJ26273.1 ABC transporter substrate-binding protein [Salella cibi]
MSERLNRRTVLRGLGVAGMAGLAGCSSGGDNGDGGDGGDNSSGGGGGGGGGGSTDRTLRQGVLMPETGDLASLGTAIRDGAILPFALLEDDEDNPFELDYTVGDTQTNPNAGVSAANNLNNQGYPAITGAASSEVSIAVYENVLIPNGIVGCSPASTSPAITDLEDNGLVYRTPPTDALQGEVLSQVAMERENASTAATLYVNNSYGQLLSESFSSAFESDGGTVQTTVAFEQSQSSYAARLSDALADDPDILIVIGYPESGIQLFRDYYSNYDGSLPILVTDGLQDSALPSEVGNAMENVKGTAPLAAGPGRDYFAEQYQNEYDSEPGVFTSQAFDATAVCLLANAAAGENDGAAIAQEMQNVANPGGEEVMPSNLGEGLAMAAEGTEIQYVGASSAVDFDENGDLQAATYQYFGFEEGGGIRTIDEIQYS